MKKTLYLLLFLFSTFFIFFSFMFVRELLIYKQEEKSHRILQEQVKKIKKKANENKESPYAESGNLIQFDKLWEKNPDMVGWLSIEGTSIEYPVMYTPNKIDYYLHKGFNKKYSRSGSLFIGNDWNEESNYALIYGHNMKNGTMFGTLEQYKDEKFTKEHPSILFASLKKEEKYDVIGAFYINLSDEKSHHFQYYNYPNLKEEKIFNEYLNQIRENSLYDLGIEIHYGDKILTLSTCSYNTKNERFVVVARKKV